MPIKFRCPHCEQFLGISDSKAGTVTDCPTCGRSIRIPALDGTVAALPAPRLNLQDDQLLAALGALATVHEVRSETSLPSSPAQPASSPVHQAAAAIEVLKTSRAADEEVLAIAVPHIEDAPEFPVSHAEALAQLDQMADKSTVAAVPAERGEPQFKLAAMLGASVVSLLCGVLIGLALRGNSRPASAKPVVPVTVHNAAVPAPAPVVPMATSQVRGLVTYPGPAGDQKPDRGARVLVLPLDRQGFAKLSGQGFRVGADETDRHLMMAAATVLGGNFELADSQGEFQVSAPKPGRYGLLVASRYLHRPDSILLSEECRKFLQLYFDRPELVLGNVEYQFQELTLDAATPAVRNVQFAVR